MQPVSATSGFPPALASQINQNFAGLTPLIRNAYYLDPSAGSDAGDALSPATAVRTLQAAYAKCVSGKNDAVVLVGDGGTSASARLGAGFAWAKNATHLIGLSSGVNISNRSRIAPTSGVTAFAAFFTVSGSGCLFQNIQWFQGFSTGVAASICVAVTGGRNLFENCHFAGMGDDASAQDTGSRSLKISGTGENQFVNCAIGVDTVTRTVANASVELAGASPRNEFRGCTFLVMSTSADALGVLGAAAGAMDRYVLFSGCRVLVTLIGGGIAITGFAKFAASAGGMVYLDNPTAFGVTTWGYDATTDTQMRVVGGVTPSNGALVGLGVAPAA